MNEVPLLALIGHESARSLGGGRNGKTDTGESPRAGAEFNRSSERTGWIFRREDSNPQPLYPLRHSPIFLLANKNNKITFGVKLNEANDIRDNKPRRKPNARSFHAEGHVLFTPPRRVNSPRPRDDFRRSGETLGGGIISDDK